jgi:DNA-binding transcriptional regulator YiaG
MFMTGKEFKDTLKRLRVQQKQFALMNDMTVQGVNKWVSTNQIPKWAENMLMDWGKYPDLIEDNMRRAGLI